MSKKVFLSIFLFAIVQMSLAQNCEKQFVDNMLSAYPENNAKLLIELQKHWPTKYTKTVNINGINVNQTHSIPDYSDTLCYINIGVVLGSKTGMKIDGGKCHLPKQDYLCYYDCNNIIFGESVIYSNNQIIGCVDKYKSKRKYQYDFYDYETISHDNLYRLLLDIQPDVTFRLAGQGNYIVYYIKDKQLMAICAPLMANERNAPYEVLTYKDCFEKYVKKLPWLYFSDKYFMY